MADSPNPKDLINGLGAIAEMMLVFYRACLGAKATEQEALKLTQAYIAALTYGNPNRKKGDKDNEK